MSEKKVESRVEGWMDGGRERESGRAVQSGRDRSRRKKVRAMLCGGRRLVVLAVFVFVAVVVGRDAEGRRRGRMVEDDNICSMEVINSLK